MLNQLKTICESPNESDSTGLGIRKDGRLKRLTHTAFEKHEIIRIVEQSHLPVRRTLKQLGIPR